MHPTPSRACCRSSSLTTYLIIQLALLIISKDFVGCCYLYAPNIRKQNSEKGRLQRCSLCRLGAPLETFLRPSRRCLDFDQDATSCRSCVKMAAYAQRRDSQCQLKRIRLTLYSRLHCLLSVRLLDSWLICILCDAQQIVILTFANGRDTGQVQDKTQNTERELKTPSRLRTHDGDDLRDSSQRSVLHLKPCSHTQ